MIKGLQEKHDYQQGIKIQFNKAVLDHSRYNGFKKQFILINNNLFNVTNISIQLRDIIHFYSQRNFYYQTQSKKYDSQKEMINNMKGNIPIMTQKEGRMIMWQQIFAENHVRSNTLVSDLDKLVHKINAYKYNYIHDPKKQYESPLDYQIDKLQCEGIKLQQDLLQQAGVIRNKIRAQQNISRELVQFKLSILKMEKDIFFDCIVAIQELDFSNVAYERINVQPGEILVKIYMEQCYPYLIMSKQDLILQFGEKIYKQKKKRMPLHHQGDTQRLKQHSVISCHYCQGILDKYDVAYQCSSILTMEHLKPTFVTNPQLYHQIIYGYDYIDPCGYRAIKPDYSYPYQTYHHFVRKLDTKKKLMPSCRRVYCQRCYKHQIDPQCKIMNDQNPYRVYKPSQIPNFCCCFCDGSCLCPRCKKCQYLTYATAYYMKLGGSLQTLISNFIFPKCRKVKTNIARITKGSGKRIFQKRSLRQIKRKIRTIQMLYSEGAIFIQPKPESQIKSKSQQGQKKPTRRLQKRFLGNKKNQFIPIEKIDLGLEKLYQKQKGVNSSIVKKGYGKQDSQSWQSGISQSSESEGQIPLGNIQIKRNKSHLAQQDKQKQVRINRLKDLQQISIQRKLLKKKKQQLKNAMKKQKILSKDKSKRKRFRLKSNDKKVRMIDFKTSIIMEDPENQIFDDQD